MVFGEKNVKTFHSRKFFLLFFFDHRLMGLYIIKEINFIILLKIEDIMSNYKVVLCIRIVVYLTALVSGFFPGYLAAQKQVYIPNYLKDTNTIDGKQFSWDKTHESENFILIWGETVGTDPKNYSDPDLQFDPVAVLDTMEYIYNVFKNNDFLDDSPGTNMSKYKTIIVMYNTWGSNGAQGWANGGDADGVIGAFWVHPNGIRDGGVAAHEFTHSLQAQNNIDYRAANGLGGAWYNAGIFWETHANYMRNLLYPQAVGAWGMDVYHLETWGDWKNTYENYQLLMAIHLSEGPGMISKIWREADSYEYPLQAYKRLAGYTQLQFNDSLYQYARRMACYDFNFNNWGAFFRKARTNDLMYNWMSVQSTFNILKAIPNAPNRYEIPIEQAPEEYAYNIIPLHVESDSCAVIVKFKGHTDANEHAGWRYGFVTEKPNGEVSRYSPTYGLDETEINFKLLPGESGMYFVVMGAPKTDITTDNSNDTWHGYPKHYRFPYELAVTGAYPEGHQDPGLFRSFFKGNGHVHPNGGGWVDNSSNVSTSVYIGPHAMVLGNSDISGNVVIDKTAVVVNSDINDDVLIDDNAFVNNSTISENARVLGHAYTENVTMSGSATAGMRAKIWNYKLSGTAEVGGDVIVYNENGNCDNGVQYVLTNYYDNKLLDCDGKTAEHPVNKDVNNSYPAFTDEMMSMKCNCDNLPDCKTTSSLSPHKYVVLNYGPNPTHGLLSFNLSNTVQNEVIFAEVIDAIGKLVLTYQITLSDHQVSLDIGELPKGVYFIRFNLGELASESIKVVKIE